MKITRPHINDLRSIQINPNSSVFWITDTQARAIRIARFERHGYLNYQLKQYPYGHFELAQKAIDLLKEQSEKCE